MRKVKIILAIVVFAQVPGAMAESADRKISSSAYLPWTLDVNGYPPGKCETTDLARSFKEARGWASENSSWIRVHNIVESEDKISISLYDSLLRAESIRTFYKDMGTCKKYR